MTKEFYDKLPDDIKFNHEKVLLANFLFKFSKSNMEKETT